MTHTLPDEQAFTGEWRTVDDGLLSGCKFLNTGNRRLIEGF